MKYGEWVPFHASLCEGEKRGLSRATRFIYLELCLKARRFDGVLPLPRGFRSEADAVHDLIGGDRREIRIALAELTAVSVNGQDKIEPMIALTRSSVCSTLTISAHGRVGSHDKSTSRVRKHREKQREESRIDSEPGNAFHPVTETVTERVSETPYRREEKRKEENREPPVVPPLGDPATRELFPVCSGNAKNDDGVQAAEPKGRRRKPETDCPPTEASRDEVSEWAKRWRIPETDSEFENFLDHHRSKQNRFSDWCAAWKKWQRNGRKWGSTGRPGRIVQGYDPDAPWLKAGSS